MATNTVMVLGPFLDNVIEPMPPSTDPQPGPVAGRRQIGFHTTPTAPGGNVNLVLQPAVAPTDVMPVNVYAFFVQPIESIPAAATRTADWFFKSGAKSHSVNPAVADATTGQFTMTVPGVTPSLQPYWVQIIFEFPA